MFHIIIINNLQLVVNNIMINLLTKTFKFHGIIMRAMINIKSLLTYMI